MKALTSPVRLAVLDAGSNSAHLQVADLSPGQPPVPVCTAKWRIRLAEGGGSDGSIEPGAIARLAAAATEAAATARACGAAGLAAFTTAAVRDAPNRAQVTAQVKKASGITLEVLPGEDEARLEFLAVRRWHGWSAGPLLLLDLGGGSLEISYGDGERPGRAVSVPLGAGRLSGDFLHSDPPRHSELLKLRQHVASGLAEAAEEFRDLDAATAVATSTTFHRLARLTGAPRHAGAGHPPVRLDAAALHGKLPKLESRSDAKRAKLRGISRRRARQLLAGAVVADAAMTVLDLPSVRICPWALREGVLLRQADTITAAGPPQVSGGIAAPPAPVSTVPA